MHICEPIVSGFANKNKTKQKKKLSPLDQVENDSTLIQFPQKIGWKSQCRIKKKRAGWQWCWTFPVCPSLCTLQPSPCSLSRRTGISGQHGIAWSMPWEFQLGLANGRHRQEKGKTLQYLFPWLAAPSDNDSSLLSSDD